MPLIFVVELHASISSMTWASSTNFIAWHQKITFLSFALHKTIYRGRALITLWRTVWISTATYRGISRPANDGGHAQHRLSPCAFPLARSNLTRTARPPHRGPARSVPGMEKCARHMKIVAHSSIGELRQMNAILHTKVPCPLRRNNLCPNLTRSSPRPTMSLMMT